MERTQKEQSEIDLASSVIAVAGIVIIFLAMPWFFNLMDRYASWVFKVMH